jgi:hypothetical protein
MRSPGHTARGLAGCAPFLFTSAFRYQGGVRRPCEALSRYPRAIDLTGALQRHQRDKYAELGTTYTLVGMVCHSAETLAANGYETVVRRGGTGGMEAASGEPARWLHFTGTGAAEIDEAAVWQEFRPQLLLWRREPPVRKGGDPVTAQALATAAER